MDPLQTEVKRSCFPKDFIFGGATSAYQVEGAWNVDGKGWNNWDYMTENYPDSIADRSNGKEAINHYNMFKDDVALMKEVGLDAYRFSISWSRILPGGKLCDGISKEGIQFYNDLIDTLLKGGIEPCATIFHWDVPQSLEDEYGGFLNYQIVEHFCEFAEICFWEFGDRVKYWITLNEPRSFTYCGYVVARFPPRRGYRLATSLERLMRSSILHHRSPITIRPCTSSKEHMARKPVAQANSSRSTTSGKRDPIGEPVDQAHNSRSTTSRKRDPIGEPVDQAHNSRSTTSSKRDPIGEPVDQAHNSRSTTSRKRDPIGEPAAQAHNSRSTTSPESDPITELVDMAGDFISELADSSERDPITELVDMAGDFISELADSSERDPITELVDMAGDFISELADSPITELVDMAGNFISELSDSSERDPIAELVDMADKFLTELIDSSEKDPITELVDMACKLPYDTISSEVGAVIELIAEACNWPYCASSEGVANDGTMADDSVPPYTSSEGKSVREAVSGDNNLPHTSSEGNSVREDRAHNLHHLTSSKGDPGREPYIVAHNLILAHAHAVNIYRKYFQEHQKGKIGMTNVSVWYDPLDENNPEHAEAALRAIDFYLGWFVDPVITGDYPPSMRNNVRKRLPKFKPDEVALVKGSCDFLGINYYTARYAKNVPRETSITHFDNDHHVADYTHRGDKPIGEQAGSDWLYIFPEGIYKMMLYMKERYNNPEIFITENGMDELNDNKLTISQACIDEKRVKYYKDHLAYLRQAIDDGVRLKGYFIWSFFDNFEWNQGYKVRFGVYHVDFVNGKLKRYPKTSAEWWKSFLTNKPMKLKDAKPQE